MRRGPSHCEILLREGTTAALCRGAQSGSGQRSRRSSCSQPVSDSCSCMAAAWPAARWALPSQLSSAATPVRNAIRRKQGCGAARSTSSRWIMRPMHRCWAISTMLASIITACAVASSAQTGKFFVETEGPDGKLATFEVNYTFGIEPLQQYLIEFPDGRLQALSLAWDSRPKEQGGQRWFHLYPEEEIKHDDVLHWTKLNQNWN